MRPRCCFRYFTFFGITILVILALAIGDWRLAIDLRLTIQSALAHRPSPIPRPPPAHGAPRRPVVLLAPDARDEALALVEPHLHADLAVGGARLGKAVVDVR